MFQYEVGLQSFLYLIEYFPLWLEGVPGVHLNVAEGNVSHCVEINDQKDYTTKLIHFIYL